MLQVEACPGGDTGAVCPVVTLGESVISDKYTPGCQARDAAERHGHPGAGYPAYVALKVMQGDTEIEVTDSALGVSAETALSGTHQLPPGDYRVVADVTSPSACNVTGADLTVPLCLTSGGPDDTTGDDTPPIDDIVTTPPQVAQPRPGVINWCLILFWSGFALFLIGALSPLCFIGWMIDVGFASYLLLAHFRVFFSGCESYSDWWPDWLQFTMPDSLRTRWLKRHQGREYGITYRYLTEVFHLTALDYPNGLTSVTTDNMSRVSAGPLSWLRTSLADWPI